MTQQEYIELLNRDLKELGDLLAGMKECETIPAVFLTMARDKALRMAEGFEKLASEGKSVQKTDKEICKSEEKPVASSAVHHSGQVNLFKNSKDNTREMTSQPVVKEPELKSDCIEAVSENQLVAQEVEKPVEQEKTILPIQQKEVEPKEIPVKEVFEPVFRQFSQVPSQSAPKTDIRSLMTLNDRFLFQRELFRGDIGLLNYTLDEVNKRESMKEALLFLEKEYKWDPEAVGVKEFLELLERHFEGTII